jgi:glyoxylase-like metal-dependent hydrolase (beta-lactamase superfamily II)
MYGINRVRSLDESLKAIAGVTSSDITIVINTHLHFDHAGGNTLVDESGKAVPAFRTRATLFRELNSITLKLRRTAIEQVISPRIGSRYESRASSS